MTRRRTEEAPAVPLKPKQPAPDDVPTVPAAAGECARAARVAELAHSPLISSAATADEYARYGFGTIDLNESVRVLVEQADKVKRGDLGDVEAMLYGQASALHSIFDTLARRAAHNLGAHLGATETYLRLALKAQSQCRTTLEALAELKNPRPVAFVKQANIAHGHQQVNNGASPAARAREHQNPPNELLKDEHGQGLDARASGIAGATHPRVAAVGALHRAED